jgi:hypothetical protein
MTEDVTLGEIARKLDRHIEDSKQNSLETRQNNKNQNEMLQLLVVQSTAVKGDITNLQKEVTSHEALLNTHGKSINSLNGARKYFMGAMGILSIVGWSLYQSAANDLKSDLTKDISTTLKKDLTQGFEDMLDARVKGVYLDSK